MEINKNNWHAKFYYWTYKNYPNSLCPYFWKLLVAFILLPITFVGYFLRFLREDREQNLAGYMCFTVIFWIIFGFGWDFGATTFENLPIFLSVLIGFLIILISTLLVLILFFAIIYFFAEYLPKKMQSKSKDKGVKTNIINERIKAFKGKYCPKIDWKN